MTSCLKILDNGDIHLSPYELVYEIVAGDFLLSSITLSGVDVTLRWFMDFLDGAEIDSEVYKNNGKIYNAFRDSGNVFLQETSENGFVRICGFSQNEILDILDKLHEFMPKVPETQNNSCF